VEYEKPVSNEAEFESWLASAFENEQKRLFGRAARSDLHSKTVSERARMGEKDQEDGDVTTA